MTRVERLQLIDHLDKDSNWADKVTQKQLEEMAALGLIRLGFNDAGGNFRVNAQPTPLGKKLLDSTRIQRSALRGFFYRMRKWL